MESDHHAPHHGGQAGGGVNQQSTHPLTPHTNLQQNIHHALAATQHNSAANAPNDHGVVVQNATAAPGGGSAASQQRASAAPTVGAAGSSTQQFCLRWNNFQSNIVSSFETLLDCEELVDVTISCDGRSVRAHKILLSACSPYFRDLFQSMPPQQHPVVVLRETRFNELKSLLCFIYHGEVNVSQENLPRLLNLAEALKVKGLAQEGRNDASQYPNEPSDEPARLPGYPHDREDNTTELPRANHPREAVSPSPVNFPNLSALGSLLNTGKVPRSTPVGFERPASLPGRNTPLDSAYPPQNPSSSSPPAKRRKRQLSPKSNTSQTTPNNDPSSVSSAENNASPPREDAVNLSTATAAPPPSSSPSAPRLMILKEELIASDQEAADKEKEQRDRLSHLLDNKRFGMMKIPPPGSYMDSEGEEEPPPPHEDENSGDLDSHERGGGTSLSLSHPLQQPFVPYPPSSLPGHHFANSFTPGSSSSLTATSASSWRSHSNDQNPNSPQESPSSGPSSPPQLTSPVSMFFAPRTWATATAGVRPHLSLPNLHPLSTLTFTQPNPQLPHGVSLSAAAAAALRQRIVRPSHRPAHCPACGRYFTFGHNMKAHLKRCPKNANRVITTSSSSSTTTSLSPTLSSVMKASPPSRIRSPPTLLPSTPSLSILSSLGRPSSTQSPCNSPSPSPPLNE